jgi:hypothetical protein
MTPLGFAGDGVHNRNIRLHLYHNMFEFLGVRSSTTEVLMVYVQASSFVGAFENCRASMQVKEILLEG